RDVIVVASVSCIYGIGAPETYQGMHLSLAEGQQVDRDEIVRQLVAVQYERNDYDFHRGTFRVRGDIVEVFPANEESQALRVELFGDSVEAIRQIDPLRGAVLGRQPQAHVYPASHYVTPADQLEHALTTIAEELAERLAFLRARNRLLEAQRLEQRTLTFEAFTAHAGQAVYVSATPARHELRLAGDATAEQIIRPTGLTDPALTVRPATEQVDDLLEEIRSRAAREERILVTCLTKRMAEDLTEYYQQMGLRVRYLHSDIDTLDRVELIRDLRLGKFDGLIGINLLREGLDIPEVSLVAILDADKEGYLRSTTSLIQTAGRAARNVNGQVIMYADRVTDSMAATLRETERRRRLQAAYNAEHGITPASIRSSIRELL